MLGMSEALFTFCVYVFPSGPFELSMRGNCWALLVAVFNHKLTTTTNCCMYCMAGGKVTSVTNSLSFYKTLLPFAGWLSRGDRCRWGGYVLKTTITAYAEWKDVVV